MRKARPLIQDLTFASLSADARSNISIVTHLDPVYNTMLTATTDLQLELDSASQEDELSPLDYARGQGLCIDYTTKTVPLMSSDVQRNAVLDENIPHSPHSTINDAASALTKERLAVSKETALLLKAVYKFREPSPIDYPQSYRRGSMLNPKLELPVLPSDHDLDLLNFARAAPHDFRNLRLPSETVVEQNDEGLEWPIKHLTYPTQCYMQIQAEKLTVSKNALLYLQEAVRDAYVPADSEVLKAQSPMKKPVSKE